MADSHAPAHPAGEPHFSEAEWQAYRAQDYTAGRMVGGLLGAIFAVGVVLYAIVLWTILI